MTDESMTLGELRDWVADWPNGTQPRESILPALDAAIRERDELRKVRDYFELHAPPTPEQWHAVCERAERAESALAGHRHCDSCGCTWIDDGLNPTTCPYCTLAALRKRIAESQVTHVGTNPDGSKGAVVACVSPELFNKRVRLLVEDDDV